MINIISIHKVTFTDINYPIYKLQINYPNVYRKPSPRFIFTTDTFYLSNFKNK